MATAFDGYPMARRGEAGRALGMAAFASSVGGIFSVLVLNTVASKTCSRLSHEVCASSTADRAYRGVDDSAELRDPSLSLRNAEPASCIRKLVPDRLDLSADVLHIGWQAPAQSTRQSSSDARAGLIRSVSK